MKKQLTIWGLCILILSAMAFTAISQQEKNKGNQKNEQQQNQDKGKQDKGKQDKGKQDNKAQDKASKEKKDNANKSQNANENKGQNANENKGRSDVNENKGRDETKDRGRKEDNMGRGNQNYGYNWNRETFRDREKFRDQEKVTLCHKFNSNDEPAVTIRVSANALQAHLNHGDVRGDCPSVTDSRFSNDFLRTRQDYYNILQQNQEQVVYSRSILDYALARLAESRLQLNQYRASGMPAADIERKQVVVLELERNVSLLDALIATAATVAVNKLVY